MVPDQTTIQIMPSIQSENPVRYAFVGHESAVEAIWSLASRKWRGVLDDEDIWLLADESSCVRTQRDFKQLSQEVDLPSLGVRHTPLDLLVPNKSCYSRGKLARFHVWKGFFAEHSFVRLHERVFVSTPYFAAMQLAVACKPDRISRAEAKESANEEARIRAELGLEGDGSTAEELVRWGNISRFARAVQVMCDFMGTYRYVPEADKQKPDDPDVIYGEKRIIRPEQFAEYLEKMPTSKGIVRARQVAAAAFVGSASPMETMLAILLSLPVKMGGFGLPRPTLNHEVTIEPEKRFLTSQDDMVGDLCWPDKRVIVEYYGWKEHFGAGPRKVAADAARANSLVSLGWTVLHVTFEQAKTLDGISLLARQIAHALGCELRAPSDLEMVWRMRLLAQLLPKVSIREW